MGFVLEVENFRGIRRARFAPEGVCALTGANGSGKSTFLSVFEFLSRSLHRSVGEAVRQDGGTARLRHLLAGPDDTVLFRLQTHRLKWELRLTLGDIGLVEPVAERVEVGDALIAEQRTAANQVVLADGSTRLAAREQSVLARLPDLAPDVARGVADDLDLIRAFRLFRNPHLHTLRTAGSEAAADTYLHGTGRNAFTVLRNWKAGRPEHEERYRFVVAGLVAAFPGVFEAIGFEPFPETIRASFVVPGLPESMPARSMPDGVLMGLLHLCAVASTPPGGFVAIDEFENGLHPFAIAQLVEAIRMRARQYRLTVALATHSPVVLNRFQGEEAERLFVAQEGAVAPVTQLVDRNWLASFAPGDMYADRDFGAPEAAQQPPSAPEPDGGPGA